MKKRIISLILVVVMTVLALTSCAYNYAKKDLSEFTSFNGTAFGNGLKDKVTLLIDDGDFGLNEDERAKKVKDTILTALAKLATEKLAEGEIDGNDSVAYCYYATATIKGKEYVFYADKMQESKPTTIQLGLSTLEGLDAEIADVLEGVNVTDYLYATNSGYVAKGDKVYVTYTESFTYGEDKKSETKVTYKLVEVADTDALGKLLEGKKVGATYQLTSVGEKRTVDDKEYTVDVSYSDLTVDKVFKTKDEGKVQAGDVLFVTYTEESAAVTKQEFTKTELVIPADTAASTKTFLGQLIGAETNKELTVKAVVNGTTTESYTKVIIDSIKNGAEGDKVKAGDTVVISYSYSKSVSSGKTTYTNKVVELAPSYEKEDKSFFAQLVGKSIGSSATINAVETTGADGAVTTTTYTSVKVNWSVESDLSKEIVLNYIAYPKADNEKAVSVTAVDGYKIEDLRDVNITYHIFPVYYNEVGEVTAQTVLEEYYSAAGSYTEEEHDEDEADEDHEHEKTYNFDSVQKGEYKNGEDTLLSLIETLTTLQGELTTAEKEVSTKLTALKTAQEAVDNASTPTTTQNTNLTKAKTEYNNAVKNEERAKKAVDEQIDKILKCTNEKKGDIKADLVTDYEKYTYKTLEDTYKDEIKQNLAKAIYTFGKECLGDFTSLPRKAVMDAYKRIEDSHKTDFYKKPTKGSSTETDYKKFGGDFDLYLKYTYFPEDKNYANIDMQKVHDAIGLEAEEAVKELIYLYMLVDAVSDLYGEDLYLTKSEKKDCKTQAEQMEQFYMYYMGSSVEMDPNDYINAAQLDKVLDFLLEEDEAAEGLKLEFKNIKYDFKADEEDEKTDSKG